MVEDSSIGAPAAPEQPACTEMCCAAKQESMSAAAPRLEHTDVKEPGVDPVAGVTFPLGAETAPALEPNNSGPRAHAEESESGTGTDNETTTSTENALTEEVSSASEACEQDGVASDTPSSVIDEGILEERRNTEDLLIRLQIVDGTGPERRADIHVERSATVGELKARHFRNELACGLRMRCVFLGRPLADSEPVAQLPSGAFLQCYLQTLPGASTAPELFLGWPQYADGRLAVPSSSRWHDLAFHAVFVIGLASAWAARLANAEAFDNFTRFALNSLSLAWTVVCWHDFIRSHPCQPAEPEQSPAAPAPPQ